MANSGFKNVSASFDESGLVFRYQVRVQWKGRIRQAWFHVSDFRDPEETLAAALEFRHRAEDELGKPRTERRIIGTVAGVHLEYDGRGKASYVATSSDVNGKIIRKHFSIAKFGKAKAQEMALEQRKRMVREQYGGNPR